MSDERRKVLEMLEAGKITQEDAIRLLEALGESGGTGPAAPVEEKAQPSAAMEQAARNLSDAAEEALQGMAGEEPAGVMAPVKEAHTPSLPVPEAPKGGYEACPPPSPSEERYEYRGGSEIDAIDISWVSGPVEVRAYDGPEIRVTEYAKRPLRDGQMLMMQNSDGKLIIRWSREKVSFGIMSWPKHLIVELPQAVAAKIENFKCANVSGKVYVTGMAGEDFTVSSTSGAIYVGGVTAEDLRINSVSGKLEAECVSAEDLHVNTTSGSIRLHNFAAQDVRLDSVSGSIEAAGNAEKFKFNTVSGSQHLTVAQCPEEASFNSVSGSVHFILPENQGFTAKYSSMSGRFETNFPVCGGTAGGKKGKVTYGSGDAMFSLGTMSGSMKLERA